MTELRVIIASLPGTWQRILQSQFQPFPSVKVIGVANGSFTAVEMVNEHLPDIVCIDSSIPISDAIAVIGKIKHDHPEIITIVIGDTFPQRNQLRDAGVDYVFSSYKFADQIRDVIDQLVVGLKDSTKKS